MAFLKRVKKIAPGEIKWTKQKMMIKVMTILKRLKQKVDVNLVWQEGGGGGLKMYLKEYLIFEKIQNFKKRWTWVTSGRRQLTNSKSEQ